MPKSFANALDRRRHLIESIAQGAQGAEADASPRAPPPAHFQNHPRKKLRNLDAYIGRPKTLNVNTLIDEVARKARAALQRVRE